MWFWYLAFFIEFNVFQAHPCCRTYSFNTWIVFHCRNIPYFVYPFINWWIHGLFPLFWLLWKMLLLTSMYKFLCGHMFSFLLGIFWGVELLGNMVTLWLTFWGTAKILSKVAAPFLHSYHQCMRVSVSPCPHQYLFCLSFGLRHSSRHKVVSHCGFDLHFPDA